ncbi:MAG: translation elongation factor Ts [Coriobacteriales bacterium]|nr:translation elongation factor Ts [Coriobacteriales bacterium]
MAQITAALVKQLREQTGAGMMECKKALTEADGDMDKAIDVLRTRGLAAAQKKQGRATNEGVVAVYTSEDGKLASLLEVNCETDFVARTDKFKDIAAGFAKAVAVAAPADIDALKAVEVEGTSVADQLTEAIHIIGENMQLGKFARETLEGNGLIDSYIHGEGNIGVLVSLTCTKPETAANDEFKTLAHDIALQIAAMNPIAIDEASVPADVVEHEKAIYKEQAAESGKPEEIQEKMATGRLKKFFKEVCLVDQVFVKDPDLTIKAYIAKVEKATGDQIAVAAFDRVQLGSEN